MKENSFFLKLTRGEKKKFAGFRPNDTMRFCRNTSVKDL